MDFALSGEQQLIKDSALRFVAERGAMADAWPEFANLGWLALGAPEELGGVGGAVEWMLVMEALGRGASHEPLAACGVFPSAILRAARRNDLLESLCDGSRRFAVAYEEPHARYDPVSATTSAQRTANGYRLRGRKSRVVVARAPATFLVSARLDEQVALFAVAPETAGLARYDDLTEDGGNVATLEFNDVAVDGAMLVGAPADGLGLLQLGLDHAIGAVCAEAFGLMSVMFDMTLRYCKERTQFGVPIGSFQVLQHRLAEMFMELELGRSMACVAAMTLDDEKDAPVRSRAMSGAKVQIARSSRFIGQNSIQLHGAIAMTAEYKLGDYFKRLTTLERLFGDVDFHLSRYLSLTPSPELVRMRSSQMYQSTLERNAST